MKTAELPQVNRLTTNGNLNAMDVVDIEPLEFRTIAIPIFGKTPLIVHAWSKKAADMIFKKQTGEPSKGREKKDPFEDFKGSLYPMPDGKGYGFPAPAFKACAVTSANAVELKMTQMKQAFHVNSYIIPIVGKPIKSPITEWDEKYAAKLKAYHAMGISMRMDFVRLATGVADIRFRAWYPVWQTILEVEYNPRLISLKQLVNLFESGGNGCGIGEWRPSAPECRSGTFGRFTVNVNSIKNI